IELELVGQPLVGGPGGQAERLHHGGFEAARRAHQGDALPRILPIDADLAGGIGAASGNGGAQRCPCGGVCRSGVGHAEAAHEEAHGKYLSQGTRDWGKAPHN
ncbi:MAG: hypothetical protein RLZZ142_2434, partial [Verrucomicrobiota bacterium]